eukprot:s1613_g17.t1
MVQIMLLGFGQDHSGHAWCRRAPSITKILTVEGSGRRILPPEHTSEMSFLAGLFNWNSADAAQAATDSRGRSGYSFERLQQLYNRLAQFRESDLEKSGEGDALIETVRQITEVLIWGEQTNNSQFFDFFCEKSIFSDLVHVLGLKKASKKVKLQLLQTLSMLVQNIRRQTSVYYILSNNHVNRLMSTNMDFDDEEVLAYYITLMKSLAMRLDNESIKFFFIQHPEPSFPLYIEATKFFSHKDHMVRATVRTITLQVYKIEDQPMRRFVLRHAAESYFSQLAYHLQDLWLRLNAAASKVTSEDELSAVRRENELQQDLQIYLSDVFELGIEELNEVLADRLLNGAILPVLLAGVSNASAQRNGNTVVRTLSPHVALFLIRQVLDTFHCPVLVEPMAQALLWSTVPAALAYVLPGQVKEASFTTKEGDFVKNPLRDSFLATLRLPENRPAPHAPTHDSHLKEWTTLAICCQAVQSLKAARLCRMQGQSSHRPKRPRKSRLPRCCGKAPKGDEEPLNIDCSREVQVSSTTQIEWDSDVLNVAGPKGPYVVGDANERLHDVNQWVDAEQKDAQAPQAPQAPQALEAPQVFSSVTEPAPVVDLDARADALAGGNSLPVPQAFESTEPSSDKLQVKEDFETPTGIELVRANLLSCTLKDAELSLSDILQAKVAAIRAMAEATASYRFENAKQLKQLRDSLSKEQTAMWARLTRLKHLHEQIAARVAEAVEAEDFGKAEEVYQLQRLAEESIQGFCLDEKQGGSVDLSKGSILLGPSSDFGLLEGDFTIEFWVRCQEVTKRQPLVTSSMSCPGSFPSLYLKPGGGLELVMAGERKYSSKFPVQKKRRWMHVAITWSFNSSENDFKVAVFQDGVEVACGTEVWAINADSDLRLGPFMGNLCEFRTWAHAKSAREVELSMYRRCGGEEPGLECCLSLRPARGLADSTVDPQTVLESGHAFLDRGQCEGDVTWDGDCPRQLLDSDVQIPAPAKPEFQKLDADPWTDESLQRAWIWLDSRHETEASLRRSLAEHREAELEQRQVQEQQRKAYLELQEERRIQQEQEEAKAREEARDLQ